MRRITRSPFFAAWISGLKRAGTLSKTQNQKDMIMPRIRLERSPNGDITSRAKTADRNHLMQLSHQRYLAASGLAEQPSMSFLDQGIHTSWETLRQKAFLDALD